MKSDQMPIEFNFICGVETAKAALMEIHKRMLFQNVFFQKSITLDFILIEKNFITVFADDISINHSRVLIYDSDIGSKMVQERHVTL